MPEGVAGLAEVGGMTGIEEICGIGGSCPEAELERLKGR